MSMVVACGFSGTSVIDGYGPSNAGGWTEGGTGITALSWWEYRCIFGFGREKWRCFRGSVRERVLIGGGRFRALGTMVCDTVSALALRRW